MGGDASIAIHAAFSLVQERYGLGKRHAFWQQRFASCGHLPIVLTILLGDEQLHVVFQFDALAGP